MVLLSLSKVLQILKKLLAALRGNYKILLVIFLFVKPPTLHLENFSCFQASAQ